MTYNYLLISFQSQEPAKVLVSYLQSQAIKVVYHQVKGEFMHAVYLLEPQQQQRAKYLIEEFLQQPGNPKYQQAAWQHGEVNSVSEPFLKLPTPRQFFVFPVTASILIICLIVFSLSYLGWNDQIFYWLRIQEAGASGLNHQYWRLVGPALFHFSTLHLIFNVLWWWILGKQIEQKFGSSSLFLLFVLSAVIPNLAQYWISGPNFGGLSGVVYALFGFVWWIGWLRPGWGLGLPKNLVIFLLIWLLIGYADIFWVKMANTAHTGGLICGCLFALVTIQASKLRKQTSKSP